MQYGRHVSSWEQSADHRAVAEQPSERGGFGRPFSSLPRIKNRSFRFRPAGALIFGGFRRKERALGLVDPLLGLPVHPIYQLTRPVPCDDGRMEFRPMKIRNSLKSVRGRHRDNQLVRRKGRVYIINKTQKRYKARQG